MNRTILPAAALATALLLSACGGTADDEASDATSTTPPSAAPTTPTTAPSSDAPTRTPTPTPTPEAPAGPTLAVTVAGEDVTPNAEEIDLGVGEPLTITFTSDRAGELHVHSKPEQYVEFGEGTTTRELVVETPGSVEIEEHDTGAVVAVVQVS